MGQAELTDVVRATTHPRLRVVTAGTPQASPADLLSSPVMTNVLRRMEQSYDYVIMHAPPLLSYTDAALVSDAAGGTLLTVAAGRTKAQDLTTALSVLANVRVTPLGLVLTGAQASDLPSRSSDRSTTRTAQRRMAVAARVNGAALNGADSKIVGTNGAGPNGVKPNTSGSPNPASAQSTGVTAPQRHTRPRPAPSSRRPEQPDEQPRS